VEPVKQFNVSVDYYNIKLTNDIISAFEAGGLTNYTSIVRGPQEILPFINAAGATVNQLTPVGTILFASYPYVNAGVTQVSGFDLDLRSFVDIDTIGRLSAQISYTHKISYAELVNGVIYQLAGTHGPSGISGDTGNPKDRAVLTLGSRAHRCDRDGQLHGRLQHYRCVLRRIQLHRRASVWLPLRLRGSFHRAHQRSERQFLRHP